MALNCLKNVANYLNILRTTPNINNVPALRTKYLGARMVRDVKRRKLVTEYAPLRLRIKSLRKNDVLPPELRAIAADEMAALPRDCSWMRLINRCVVTSKPRGVVQRFRLSRIVFRNLADHNQLSGMQRAMW